MCSIKSSISRGNNSNNGNKKVGTSSLEEAFLMLDQSESSLSNCSLSSDSSETSEMAAMLEAAVTNPSPPVEDSILLEDNDKKKFQKIKIIKQDKNRAQILTPLMIPSNDSGKKRLANGAPPLPVNNELAAKRAKIMSALSAPKPVEINRPITSSLPPKRTGTNAFTPSHSAKRLSVPLQPIAVKPVTPNPGTLAGGRSSIHGRKMMSIREQQEQMNKKNISEFVLRLKAEQELEKTLQKPNRRQETSQQRRGKHAAAFGSIQSVSRLPFVLDNNE